MTGSDRRDRLPGGRIGPPRAALRWPDRTAEIGSPVAGSDRRERLSGDWIGPPRSALRWPDRTAESGSPVTGSDRRDRLCGGRARFLRLLEVNVLRNINPPGGATCFQTVYVPKYSPRAHASCDCWMLTFYVANI